MGESDRYLERKFKRISLGDDKNALMALIGINAMLFISVGLIRVIYLMSNSTDSAFAYEILRFFVLPAKLDSLAVMPWTILSFMFVHMKVLNILISMVWLWVFGSIFQQIAENNKIVPLYIYGGLAGAVFFIAANYMVPSLRSDVMYHTLLGSNASVMAVAIATTSLAPGYRLFRMINGGIPLWIITGIFVIIDLTGNAGLAYSSAHLGGGLIGYLFIASYKRGYDWSHWMNSLYQWFINLFNPEKPQKPIEKIKEKVFYKTGDRKPFYKTPVITQQRIDEILDKINQKGFDDLSEEEKSILKKAAESDL